MFSRAIGTSETLLIASYSLHNVYISLAILMDSILDTDNARVAFENAHTFAKDAFFTSAW